MNFIGQVPPFDFDGLSPVYYAPNINIVARPRWGRASETRGEEPYLTAQLGLSYVRGMQQKVNGTLLGAAMLKHAFEYNLDTDIPAGGNNTRKRRSYLGFLSAAEFYLMAVPAFAASIKEAGARTVMCSYPALKVEPGPPAAPMCASELQRIVLREQLGWDGVLVSDGGAVTMIGPCAEPQQGPCHNFTRTTEQAAIVALNAGVDLNSGSFYRKETRTQPNPNHPMN